MIEYHADGTLPIDKGWIFVFGSNLSGIHGAGAALEAKRSFGAAAGIGEGLRGQSYAIPTKNEIIETLPKEEVSTHIKKFINFVAENPKMKFWVTRVGCGLAGFHDYQIAPLFSALRNLDAKISLPDQWIHFVEGGPNLSQVPVIEEEPLI